MEIETEGLVLRSTPFKDHQSIVMLFTPNMGIISCISKHLSTKNLSKSLLSSPLTRGQFILKKSSSNFYLLKEASLLDAYLEMRQSLERLKAAMDILNYLYELQLPEKPSPSLYQLSVAYLKQLKTSPFVLEILTSFFIKLLKHEGIFMKGNLPPHIERLGDINGFEEISDHTVFSRDVAEVKSFIQISGALL